ncbi:protein of unknown function [Taphrina deformans PYCC 5710]|uniref:Uncharacterized protein n=1 Tax=Taphrina deformans (strain PYCC 5710 / ATCC 11124 / CBS 356.35 / IMI 108563 / JCM 9778 / NBRC 8474) TaxID=1097556 RepID=R4X7J2_TAPDE|nr:protein of unknown function [Taphrina deformans PYCC 5710]|eukprot:CCG81386.1 protein of unknown function [Taphrina deformans PYCC 5710]
MLQRQTEVKFRDNQENRVQQFPKTPKNANIAASKFVTPAPKPRIALGAKSTNVHHRQFSSAKTGKRHSPVLASKKPLSIVAPEQAQKLEGGAALRAALNRALLTGVDIPDVEYAPPPVPEQPYDEPEWMTPMDWDALDRVIAKGRPAAPLMQCYREKYAKMDETATPPFEFMDVPQMSAKTGANPKLTRQGLSSSGSTSSKTSARPKLGRYAASTLSVQAKAKPVRQVSHGDQENVGRTVRSKSTTSAPRSLSSRAITSRTTSEATKPGKEMSSGSDLFLDGSEEAFIDSLVPDIEHQSDLEVDFD